MARNFDGAQALLKRDSSVAHFVPCFGHSLKLKRLAYLHFSIFFRTHTHFWVRQHIVGNFFVSVMLSPTVKSLSQTRWSESADAAKALRLVQSRNDWMPIPCGAKFVWVFA